MASIVFDIETIGKTFSDLDQDIQDYLLKYDKTDEEREASKGKLALWAPTAEIVTIAMLNPRTGKGKCYFQDGGTGVDDFEENGGEFVTGTEKEILEKFWDDLQHFDQVISFNGRSFDGPMLMLRSAMLGVKPTKNLVPYRYDYKQHCDLLDQLTFYSASRKFNLDMYTRAFGITSPKEGGMSGDKVGQAYADGKYVEIAQYCWGDVIATGELFKNWEANLRF